MNGFRSPDFDEDDAALNASLSDCGPDETSPDEEEALHLARIAEYQHDANRKDDPLEACVGYTIGGLLRLAKQYEKAISATIDEAETSVIEMPQVPRAVNAYLT